MSYNDETLRYFDESVDDEYERTMLHRSSTVSMYLMIWLNFGTAALLAWALPGRLRLWSLALVLPPLLANLLGENWLKQHAPRPAYPDMPRRDWAIGLPIMLTWLGGILYNAFEATAAAGVGMVFGGILGGVFAVWFTRRHNARNRRRDTERLNAESED